jgi:hypothetical protein
MFGVPAIHFARFLNEANNLFHKKGPAWTRRQTKLHRFGRNAGFIRQGIELPEPSAA